MPFDEISEVVIRKTCFDGSKGSVIFIAAADLSSHCMPNLDDPDGFVELVQQMMEDQQATGEVLSKTQASTIQEKSQT